MPPDRRQTYRHHLPSPTGNRGMYCVMVRTTGCESVARRPESVMILVISHSTGCRGRRAFGQDPRGAYPEDLPVGLPTKCELVINLRTAKALDVTIPPSLLLRADQLSLAITSSASLKSTGNPWLPIILMSLLAPPFSLHAALCGSHLSPPAGVPLVRRMYVRKGARPPESRWNDPPRGLRFVSESDMAEALERTKRRCRRRASDPASWCRLCARLRVRGN